MSTDEILVYGIVFSFPLKRPGILKVTPSLSTIILDGKILFPAVRRDEINISIFNWFWKGGLVVFVVQLTINQR